jgi:hypothetical protein
LCFTFGSSNKDFSDYFSGLSSKTVKKYIKKAEEIIYSDIEEDVKIGENCSSYR